MEKIKNNYLKLFIFFLVFCIFTVQIKILSTLEFEKLQYAKTIMHAGGQIHGIRYSNSKEAIIHHYEKGSRFFEVDLLFTEDNHLILLHDYRNNYKKLFSQTISSNKKPTLAEFMSFKMISNLTQLSFSDLMNWTKDKEDVYIVTDTKGNNVKVLKYIAQNYKDSQKYIIPQIYSQRGYKKIKKMGYQRLIWTLYKNASIDDEKVIKFVIKNGINAVTFPSWKKRSFYFINQMNKYKIKTYIHTINKEKDYETYTNKGIYGIYTDTLIH